MSEHVPYDQQTAASSADQPSAAPFWTTLGGALVIAGMALWIYLPSFRGKFILDDVSLVMNNPLVSSPDGLYRLWYTKEQPEYFPISYSTFWLERRLWGLDPVGYHFVNLVSHIVVSILIWVTLRKLSIPGAFLAALLFSVHPVNVESVASIFHLRGTLASVFFLLSIIAYLQGEENQKSTQEASGDSKSAFNRWYWLSLLAFLLAMLSKGTVAILPLVLVLIVWWQRRHITRWDGVRLAPFVLLAAVLTEVNIWFTVHRTGEVLRSASIAERLAGAGAAVWFYVSKALVPINLSLIYPQWNIRAGNPLWWPPVIAGLGVTAVLWVRRNPPQANWIWSLLLAWVFFCVALIPVMGFADTVSMNFSLVADRYQYLAVIGVVALIAAGWSYWRRHTRGTARWLTSAFASVAVGGLVILAWQQSRLFGDVVLLYQAALQQNPDCWLIHYNLGVELNQAGSVQSALEHYREAVRLKPDFIEARNNLGIALSRMGRGEEAIECFRASLQIQARRAETYYNLGNVLADLNRPTAAAEQYWQAVQLKPDYAEAWANLAAAYGDLNRWGEALAAASKAVELAQAQGLAEVARGIEAWRAANGAKFTPGAGLPPMSQPRP